MSSTMVAVLAASTKATVQFILLASAGAIAAVRPKEKPLLAPESVTVLARLANDIFLPCWTLTSIGARLDFADLKREWSIVVFGFFLSFLGFLVADLSAILFRPIPKLIAPMRVSIAQVNALAVPLVLLDSLCETSRVKADFDSKESSDCKLDAAAKLNVFMISWHIIFWSYGVFTFENHDKESRRPSLLKRCQDTLFQPNVVGLLLGLVLAITPIGQFLFREKSPIRPLGAALEILAWPMLPTTVLIMASALIHGQVKRRKLLLSSENKVSNLSDIKTHDEDKDEEHSMPPPSNHDRYIATMLWFLSARLIFVPLLGYCLAYALMRTRTYGLSKSARLVILIEFAAPSAQTVLTVLYALSLGHIAERLAPFYFLQYLLSIFTMTAFGAFALFIIYHD